MPSPDSHFQNHLLATFKIEAQEQVQSLASALVELEKASTDELRAPILDRSFRSAHSLKGAARAVNAGEVETVCHALENVFAALQRRRVAFTTPLFDLLHQAVDTLTKLLQAIGAAPGASAKPRITDLVRAIEMVLEAEHPVDPVESSESAAEATHSGEGEPPPAGVAENLALTDTVRVATAKLDAVLLQAEELISAKSAAGQQAAKLRQLQTRFAEWKKTWTKVRGDLRAIQSSNEGKNGKTGPPARAASWSRLSSFLEWNHDFLDSVETDVLGLTKMADRHQRSLVLMVDKLLEEMKQMVTLPFSALLDVFPKFVRDLSRQEGKEVELVVHGGEIEIDRRVLQEMKDPFIHLVRNCLDHGLEPASERTRQGKPAQGRIRISISPKDGSHAELVIADDGAGIDPAKVRAAAVKLNLWPEEKLAALSDEDLLVLIFQAGLSTSPIVTDLSGRGLGLAIVKEKVERLRGSVSVNTQLGRGTTFRITLPLTLARFHGVLVRVAEDLFILPTSQVERVVRIAGAEVKTVENRETIVLHGETLSLSRLGDALGLPSETKVHETPAHWPVVVLAGAGQRMAFRVDEVLNEQEVLVKSLGQQLGRVRNIAGATILSTGRVVPILHAPDLAKSAVRLGGARVPAAMPVAEEREGKKSVLIAEDSITSRTLLKNILETAGYDVTTAVDGIDAFTKLRSGDFDLVVSDVDMPRLNGFGLTAKIRADRKLAELPVVLVTALESREDREQGIDAGANAYIVKSSFDQSNLLEVLRRFL